MDKAKKEPSRQRRIQVAQILFVWVNLTTYNLYLPLVSLIKEKIKNQNIFQILFVALLVVDSIWQMVLALVFRES